MIEMYLFINPLDGMSYQTQQNLINFIDETKEPIQFRFLPFLSIKTTEDLMQMRGISSTNTIMRKKLAAEIYQVSLDFHAASFQGKKRGRNFLFAVQNTLFKEGVPYSLDVARAAATRTGIDWEMFLEDRDSELVKDALKENQKLAHEMNVQENPTLVVYRDEEAFSLRGKDATSSFLKQLITAEFSPEEQVITENFQKALPSSTSYMKLVAIGTK